MTHSPGKIEYNCRYFIMTFRTQIHKKKFCKKCFRNLQGTMSHRPLANTSSLKIAAAYYTWQCQWSCGAKDKVSGYESERLEWQSDRPWQRFCGAMDNASDYESEEWRFEACQDRWSFMWQGILQASITSWPATPSFTGPVAQWTTRLTTNQKIACSSPARIDGVLCGKESDRLVG